MSLTLDGTSGITSSGGTNVLQADAVITNNLVNGAVTTAKIADANVTIAKLSATGTPDATNFLRGDGSWQTISTTPTTDQVLSATAGASAGAVGTYGFLASGTGYTLGATVAGSTLWWTNAAGQFFSQYGSGTWRAMGRTFGGTGQEGTTLWLRIS
jgi:hypothetical protein